MKKAVPEKSIFGWLRRNWPSLLVLFLAALLFLGVRLALREENEAAELAGDYVEYERGTVTMLLSDSCFSDPIAEGSQRGVQDMIVEAETGQYAGTSFSAKNSATLFFLANMPFTKRSSALSHSGRTR